LIQDAIDIAEDPDTIKLALEANQS
jgi:hypothetical protein